MKLLISVVITIAVNIIFFFILRFCSKYYGGSEVIYFNKAITDEEKKFLNSCFKTYLLWGAVQQAIVIGLFYFLRYFLWVPWWAAIPIGCFIFMLLHFPNIVLMFAVLGMEMILLSLYYIAGIFFIPFMALTHGILATCLLFMFPESVHKNFKVLWEFFKYYREG